MEHVEPLPSDAAAWRGAFSAHAGPVLHFLRKRLPPQEAEDLLQETFLRAMRTGTPARIENLRSYLYATAKHLALNSLRRPRLVSRTSEDGSDALEEAPALHPGPHENASFRVLAEALGKALAALPPNHRRAFELAVLEGRSYEEVARETGTTLAQVKVHVYRARRRLVDVLGPFR
ncbi:MAG: sigma-70 family RNA polymerase sigma factor [Acidobacteria bacterium]|nr:sigma-70 family RNA polymerase sigma factor [Acidobacteriota bacterium]